MLTNYLLYLYAACVLIANALGGSNDNSINVVESNKNHDLIGQNSVEKPKHNDVVYEPGACHIVFSKYGCCWDGKTIPLGPHGEGCPVCKNHPHMKCKNWEKFCGDKIVDEICPETCKKCPNAKKDVGCKDRLLWKRFCRIYKSVGLCDHPYAKGNCNKTCGKCK